MRLFSNIGRIMGNIVSTLRGTAKNAKAEKPSITSHHAEPKAAVTGRRARRWGTILFIQDVAARLSAKNPFFKMRSGGTYAVGLQRNRKGNLVPSHFIRVDKPRGTPAQRKAARRYSKAMAKQQSEATA